MPRAVIGRAVRRLRSERALSQQALATRLGISASYLNLIERDQRAVTASLLIKLARRCASIWGNCPAPRNAPWNSDCERPSPTRFWAGKRCRKRRSRPWPAGSPNAARGVLALYRAWRVAREDASGIALPSGRRILLPNEEARDFFDDHANHFPALEDAADASRAALGRVAPAETNHAIAERLRRATA